MHDKTTILWLLLVTTVLMAGCSNDDNGDDATRYGIFTVVSATEVQVRGDLVDGVKANFDAMMAAHPGITKMTLLFVGGSSVSGRVVNGKETDDGMEVGRAVYQRGIATHLPAGGLVASGGTDLFASGKTTSYDGELGTAADCDVDEPTKTCIGVHAWGGGWEGNPKGTAWDIKDDKNHEQHVKYLQYYQDIGVSANFYFYTIGAAKAGGMAYMNDAQFKQYLGR